MEEYTLEHGEHKGDAERKAHADERRDGGFHEIQQIPAAFGGAQAQIGAALEFGGIGAGFGGEAGAQIKIDDVILHCNDLLFGF